MKTLLLILMLVSFNASAMSIFHRDHTHHYRLAKTEAVAVSAPPVIALLAIGLVGLIIARRK